MKTLLINILGSIINILILVGIYFAASIFPKQPPVKDENNKIDTIKVQELSDTLQTEDDFTNNVKTIFKHFNPDDITFITNSYELTDKGESELMVLAKILSKKQYLNIGFKIEGHTDNTGSQE